MNKKCERPVACFKPSTGPVASGDPHTCGDDSYPYKDSLHAKGLPICIGIPMRIGTPSAYKDDPYAYKDSLHVWGYLIHTGIPIRVGIPHTYEESLHLEEPFLYV